MSSFVLVYPLKKVTTSPLSAVEETPQERRQEAGNGGNEQGMEGCEEHVDTKPTAPRKSMMARLTAYETGTLKP